MNKTVNINLAGIIFYLDENAYATFSAYLSRVKDQFKNSEEREEIIADIEARIAELFQSKLSSGKEVITMSDVEDIMRIMGSPEDYATEDAEENTRAYGRQTEDTHKEFAGPKRLFRNTEDKILGGVSGGIAAYFGIDPLWIRLVWVALFFGFGSGFLIYIILWIVMPEAKTTAQKLQMRGEPINISNIERTVKEEMKDVQNRFSKFQESGKMGQAGSKAKNVLEDIVNAIVSIVKAIVSFVAKFIGVLFMIVGIIILVMLFGVFLGNDFTIQGVNIDWHNLTSYLNAIMPNGTTKTFFVLGVIMMAVAPIIAIILLGMRILFNYRSQNRATKVGLGVMSTLGVIFLFFTIVALVRNFAQEATYTKTIELGNNYSGYALRITDFVDEQRPYDLDWTITDKSQIVNHVGVKVVPTKNQAPYIMLEMESRGKDKLEARKRAKDYTYFLQQEDSMVNIADYFTLPISQKYRGQNLTLTVYLPVGKSIYLDETTINLLDDVKNTTNTYDPEMVQHLWVMTEEGLACADCKEGDKKWNDSKKWDSYDEQFEEEAQEFEKSTTERLEDAERKLKEAQEEIEHIKQTK